MARLIALASILAGVLFGSAARGADLLDAIRARLDAHPVVRAEFTQIRRIANLAKPLLSRGRLLVSRRDGVAWHIEQPYRTTYVLTQEVMLEIGADDSRTTRSERDAGPAARINQMVRTLVGGNSEALRSWFEVETSSDGTRWRIGLVPKQQQLAQFIKAVQVSGGEFVEDVEMVAVNGDHTWLAFRNHRAGPLTDDERGLFAGAR